jgi:hypothetical protein
VDAEANPGMAGANKVRLVVSHYPFELSKSFSFHPPLFKAGGVTPEAIRLLAPRLEEMLDRVIKARGEVAVRVRIECVDEVKDEVLGLVFMNLDVWFTRRVRGVDEMRRLHREVTEHAKRKYGCGRVDVTLVFPLRPVEIEVDLWVMRDLFELMMTTDALLNVRSAGMLFGKEFAERVSQHNREVRALRP